MAFPGHPSFNISLTQAALRSRTSSPAVSPVQSRSSSPAPAAAVASVSKVHVASDLGKNVVTGSSGEGAEVNGNDKDGLSHDDRGREKNRRTAATAALVDSPATSPFRTSSPSLLSASSPSQPSGATNTTTTTTIPTPTSTDRPRTGPTRQPTLDSIPEGRPQAITSPPSGAAPSLPTLSIPTDSNSTTGTKSGPSSALSPPSASSFLPGGETISRSNSRGSTYVSALQHQKNQFQIDRMGKRQEWGKFKALAMSLSLGRDKVVVGGGGGTSEVFGGVSGGKEKEEKEKEHRLTAVEALKKEISQDPSFSASANGTSTSSPLHPIPSSPPLASPSLSSTRSPIRSRASSPARTVGRDVDPSTGLGRPRSGSGASLMGKGEDETMDLLRKALLKVLEDVEDLAGRHDDLLSNQLEMENNLKIAHSNLVMAEMNSEMLEEALKRGVGGEGFTGYNKPQQAVVAGKQTGSANASGVSRPGSTKPSDISRATTPTNSKSTRVSMDSTKSDASTSSRPNLPRKRSDSESGTQRIVAPKPVNIGMGRPGFERSNTISSHSSATTNSGNTNNNSTTTSSSLSTSTGGGGGAFGGMFRKSMEKSRPASMMRELSANFSLKMPEGLQDFAAEIASEFSSTPNGRNSPMVSGSQGKPDYFPQLGMSRADAAVSTPSLLSASAPGVNQGGAGGASGLSRSPTTTGSLSGRPRTSSGAEAGLRIAPAEVQKLKASVSASQTTIKALSGELEIMKKAKASLEGELETLSQALFEEANKMVAEERKKRAEMEEEARDAQEERDAMRRTVKLLELEHQEVENKSRRESALSGEKRGRSVPPVLSGRGLILVDDKDSVKKEEGKQQVTKTEDGQPDETEKGSEVALVQRETKLITPSSLPEWPPVFTPEQEARLLLLASSYALGHGYTLLPPSPTNPPTSAIPAPLSLCPSPFPQTLYELAVDIQPIYNELYVRIAQAEVFLDRVMGGSVSKVDEFQGELWRTWKNCRNDLVQPLQLGLFRSDYLLHQTSPSDPLQLKQVEFNTISSSFGALSHLASNLHKHLRLSTSYFESSTLLSDEARYPMTDSLQSLAKGLAEGYQAYVKQGSDEKERGEREKSKILFVVQGGERNIFDQRWLEWELLEKYGIQVLRHTFSELAELFTISSDPSRKLLVSSPLLPAAPPAEIAVVYLRAGYTPTDYTGPETWATRLAIEKSAAIKCPSLALQLAGAKKVQQVLAEPGMLEGFLLGKDGKTTQKDIERLRETFTDLYPMDNSEYGKKAYDLALNQPMGYVLKPQREGGGNNIYRDDIPPFLRKLEEEDAVSQNAGLTEPLRREAYILMSLISPPNGLRNLLVKGGSLTAVSGEVVSELGVYGVALFEGRAGNEIQVNRGAGTLLRTKGRESDEGGVAVGYSVVDSVLLV